MPTATDPRRRAWLRGALAATLWPALARAQAPGTRFVAAWDGPQGSRLGVLEADGDGALRIAAELELPGRAHGLWLEPDGRVLAVARRPGDWLLRWRPGAATADWHWIEPDRAHTGHVLASADGRTLYTPETDLDSGQGLIGVRDAASLEKRAEWPTHGLDPHALLADGAGGLVVANGGIATRPESGRRKLAPQRMDPSLVRLDAAGGALDGQWRLPDPRLSIRHLAWGPGGRLGIALQAEHDDRAARAAAPVLALFDGRALAAAEPGAAAAGPLAGYGGDIAAWRGGWVVSCPRAGGVGLWDAAGRWAGFLPLAEACALAGGAAPWAGGRAEALQVGAGARAALPALRLDNHWLRLG